MYTPSSPESIQQLFDKIAPYYDKANSVLSLGLHNVWNRSLVNKLSQAKEPLHLLDLCAGTGEIAFGFLQRNPLAKATLVDFCPHMLSFANLKGTPYQGRFEVMTGDAEQIPLPDLTYDRVSVAYGIRNVKNKEQCLQEIWRVLKPGGTCGILELTRPTHPFFRFGHQVYLKTCLPVLGKWVAKDKEAYQYLSNSISTFIPPEKLLQSLNNASFTEISAKPLMQGIATLFLAKKP